jgi:hypothetical protein
MERVWNMRLQNMHRAALAEAAAHTYHIQLQVILEQRMRVVVYENVFGQIKHAQSKIDSHSKLKPMGPGFLFTAGF